MTSFYDLVSSWERTSRKDPVRVEGTLADGRAFVFEHDGDQATLTVDGQQTATVTHHAEHGYIDEGTYKDLLIQLADQAR